MKSFAYSLALALSTFVVPSTLAQHQTFTIDPDASQVNMTLHSTHEIVNGTFHVQTGSIDYDRSAAAISGSVVVAAGSGRTGNDSRDKKMNRDILNAQQYTTVSFAPKTYTGNISPAGDSTIQVTGVFTLLGTPHDMTIPLQLHIDGHNCTAKAHLVIPYVKWGLKDPSFLVFRVDKEVSIDLNLVGHLSS